MNREDILAQAIDWHLRQSTMPDGDWEQFVSWLEASPAHARAYDSVAINDRLLGELAPPAVNSAPIANDTAPIAANDDEYVPLHKRRWLWNVGGTGIAAAFVALMAPTLMPQAQPYMVQTAPGEQRTVQLADGTRIEMSGGTSLKLDHKDLRVAELNAGEAVFHVRHDAGAPFTVRSGGLTVQDVGTVFDVSRAGSRLDVQVAEGSVLFEPKGQALLLAKGDAVTANEVTRTVVRSRIAPEAVGEWRSGRMAFSGSTLAEVGAAIDRAYGIDLVLEGDLPQRPFTGMVRMTGAADRDIPHLAALLNTGWRRDGAKWVLAPKR